MKRRIMGILLSLSMVTALFAGCTSNQQKVDEPAKTPVEEKKEEVKTITVWSNNRHDSEYVNGKIAEFNEKNKDRVQIDYVVKTDNYFNMITMAASSGQTPDIINVSSYSSGFELSSFVYANIIQPINDYVTDDFKKITNYDDVQYEGKNVIGDKVYYVPTGSRSGMRFIYNTELFEKSNVEVPKTIDEMVEVAKQITADGEGKAFGAIVPGLSAPFARMANPISEMSGITPYDYKTGKYDFTGYKPVIQGFKQMFEDGSILPGAASMKVDPTRVQFSEGNVGFYGNASQEVGVLTDQFPAKHDWTTAPMPTLTGEVKGALSSGPNMGWMMSATTKTPELTWEVIEFLSSEEFIKGYIENGLNLPLGEYMASKVDLTKTGKLNDFQPLPYESVYPTPPSVQPEGKVYKDALWEACLIGGPDVDETIAELNRTYNEALDKAVEMGKVQRLVIKDFDPLHPTEGTVEYLDK